GVWAHHMFATGEVNLPFFSGMTFLIAVPTGVKMFNWIGTMWRGHLRFDTPMLFSIGFLVVFLIGGLTGPMIASTPFDLHVTDTYFIVAHMHYVLFGTAAFAFLALSMVVLLVNLWRTWKHGAPSGDDPWGGHSLEWATSSPPPEHNFHSLPPIRSERPVFDARQGAATPGARG